MILQLLYNKILSQSVYQIEECLPLLKIEQPARFFLVCAVENEEHCDFVHLREMLLRVNMDDLREQTHSRHYELYRRCKLQEMGFKDTDPDSQSFR